MDYFHITFDLGLSIYSPINTIVAGVDHGTTVRILIFLPMCGTKFKMALPHLTFLLGSTNILAFANGLINIIALFLKRLVLG